MNGFDGFGGIEPSAWLSYTERIAANIQLRPPDTVFEVGCGAGAFLYPFYQRGHAVAGIDFAENLIQVARRAMPRGDFQTGEALDIDPGVPADFVVSHSVFFYFPDYGMASAVLERMIRKARAVVAVLDVPDAARKAECLTERRKALGASAYRKKYAGLDHLFFDRNWFAEAARRADMTMRVEDQCIPGYAHNSFRFNVFLAKRGRPAS